MLMNITETKAEKENNDMSIYDAIKEEYEEYLKKGSPQFKRFLVKIFNGMEHYDNCTLKELSIKA